MKQQVKGKLISRKCYLPIYNKENVYTCWVEYQNIIENAELEFIANHKNGQSNLDVVSLIFSDCTITKIPQGLTKTFPNLKIFDITSSKLKRVEREDLKELSQLLALTFYLNDITLLPDDLLADMKHLEFIDFVNDNIKVIEPDLLDGLNKLKFVRMSLNLYKDMLFDSIGNSGNATLKEIKQAIRQKYLNETTAKLKLENGICSDIKRIIQNENLKDFTVKVEKEEFKVHKMVLAARSPVFLEMIENNVDAESLNLDNISVGIFRMILNYIYNDELPESNADFINLFMAADKLKINNLKEFAVEKLIEKINVQNALEILALANKYDHEGLRCKSFELIKKTVGDKKIDEYFAKQTDALKTLMQHE